MDFPYDPSDDKPLTRRQRIIFIVIFAFIFAGIISIACVIGSLPRTPVQSADWNRPDPTIRPYLPRVYSRQAWGGHAPTSREMLTHPTPVVVISETGTEACYNLFSCSEMVRSIQEHHMQSSLPDIGYNFLVGRDGNVFEGRGWDTTNMHTGFVKNCNIAISFIGTFENALPSKKQMKAVLQLLSMGVTLEKLSAEYKLLAVNQTVPDATIGSNLYKIIKKLSHYWIETERDHFHCPS